MGPITRQPISSTSQQSFIQGTEQAEHANKTKENHIAKIFLNSNEQAHLALPKIKKTVRKAYESEDVASKFRPGLVRRPSDIELGKQLANLSEKDDLDKRHGKAWTCISRRLDESGGRIYTYKYNTQIDYVDTYESIFPALEPIYGYVKYLSDGQSKQKKTSDFYTTLQSLGYGYKKEINGASMDLPDRDVLLARWEKLRQKNPDLKPLNILSSDGIAEDVPFALAFITHDGLLSSGEEFVHDHCYHILTLLEYLLACKNKNGNFIRNRFFEEEKLQLSKMINIAYTKIMLAERNLENEEAKGEADSKDLDLKKSQLAQMKILLGATADTFSANDVSDYAEWADVEPEETLYQYFKDELGSEAWTLYFKKRSGVENFNLQSLIDEFKKIT